MILGKAKLIERLGRRADDKKSLVITPLLSPVDSICADAIDLRLGTNFILCRSDRLAANVPGYAQGSQFQRPVHVPLGRHLVLPGHQTVLASTLEYMKLPPDLAAMVLTKSSWARTFISIETAPWVHPCYRGCLTLEVANVSETPLTLYPGLRVAQLVFAQVDCHDCSPDKLSGKYVGPVRPEVPALGEPRAVLHQELGLDPSLVDYPWPQDREPPPK